tara:strand:- start:651 stop:1586 length:936 start_codon:yes stop_codon:yes gene_type:complete
MAETEQLTTPQPDVHSVDVTGQDEGSLVEDVIFGGEQGTVAEAFSDVDDVEQEIAEPQPTSQEEPSVEVAPENDEVRYQYWQSQADKMRNERDQLQQQFNQVATQQVTQPQNQPEVEAEPEFPAPPEKPQKPYNFSMDEAMSDPSSESARFVQTEQAWRGEMDEYKNLQFEYQMAMMQDERDKLQTERRQDIQRREAESQQIDQINGVRSQVMDKYKVDHQTAEDFIRVMSDPASVNIDNLWRLYANDKGFGSPQPQAKTPSGEFQQVKRAQQVPASMGVMPSQTRQNEDSMEDKIIDSMIDDYNKQNPWS